ncbi:MAG: YbhN family protein [Halobacteriaceae archaeon]
MDRQRLVEGVIVSCLFVVALVLFGDPRKTLTLLTTINPAPYAIALGTTITGLLVWSETLASLLRAQGETLTPGRFQLGFVAGTGLRSLVPGGSTTGPLVLAYVVSRSNRVSGETSVAMSYVFEVFLWVGTSAVGMTGFILLILNTEISDIEQKLAAGLIGLAIFVFLILFYGIQYPESIENRIEWIVKWFHERAQGRSKLLAQYLDVEVVDERLDRFFGAFRRLGDDPAHLIPGLATAIIGWFVHALTLYFVFMSIGIQVGFAVPFIVVPVAGLTEGLSMLPGGLGVFEAAFVSLLVLLTTIDVPAATTTVILYRLSNYWFRLGLGFASVAILGLTGMFRGSIDEALSAS